MMKLNHLSSSLVFLQVFTLPNLISSAPVPKLETNIRCDRFASSYCDGTWYTASLNTTYVCGDWRLGPVQLPTKLPLDGVLEIYHRLSGLCPAAFLAKFWNSTDPDTTKQGWIYPPQGGFSVDTAGEPIQGDYTLQPGTLIDRFGSEWGKYVSPAAAPYMQRALPPSNLNTPLDDPRFPNSYHVYRVMEPLVVMSGPIAPWFGQPGQGVQYELTAPVRDLLALKKLKQEEPSIILRELDE